MVGSKWFFLLCGFFCGYSALFFPPLWGQSSKNGSFLSKNALLNERFLLESNRMNPFLLEGEHDVKMSFQQGSVLLAGAEDDLRPVEILIKLQEDPKKKIYFQTSLHSPSQKSFYHDNFRFFLKKSQNVDGEPSKKKRLILLQHKITEAKKKKGKNGEKNGYGWSFLLKMPKGQRLKRGVYDLIVELREKKDASKPLFRVISPRSYRVDPPRVGISVFFVVDNSRSMLVNDAHFQRFQKIKEIIFSQKYTSLIKNFSILSFSDKLYQVTPFSPVKHWDSTQKKLISQRLEAVKTQTQTGYHTSYATAFSQLKKLLDHTKKVRKNDHFAVIFLTDGRPTTPFQDEHRELGKGVPIFTVGLGRADEKIAVDTTHIHPQSPTKLPTKNYDVGLLQRIAKESGGKFFFANEKLMNSIYPEILNRVNDYFEKIIITKKKKVYLDQELVFVQFDTTPDISSVDFVAHLSGNQKKWRKIKPFFYDRERRIILFRPQNVGQYKLRLSFFQRGKLLEKKNVFFRVKNNPVEYSLATASAQSNLFFSAINPLGFEKRYLTLRHGDAQKAKKSFDPTLFHFFFLDDCDNISPKSGKEICQQIAQTMFFESELLFSAQKDKFSPFLGNRRAVEFLPLQSIPAALTYGQSFAWHGYLVAEHPKGWFVHDVTVDYRLKNQQIVDYDVDFNKMSEQEKQKEKLDRSLVLQQNGLHFFWEKFFPFVLRFWEKFSPF